MRIAITGHTQGLGLACANLYVDLGHTVVGLSRSNGYDIGNTSAIIDAIKDCDVFINNAYSNNSQTILLNKLFALWKDTNKIIINIGSASTVYPRLEENQDNAAWPYREHKQELEKTFRVLSKTTHQCRMQLISPGALDTNMIAHINCPKMATQDAARIIWRNMYDPYIKELILYE